MIERLCGCVVHREGAHVVIDVNGVGYGVEMPESAAQRLSISTIAVTLWIRTYVREDVIRLYGFATPRDRLFFDLLTAVNRVGPKNAMAILSHMSVGTLIDAVQNERPDAVDDVPGIGAQLAKTIVLGLKPKLKKLIESGTLRHTSRSAGLWPESTDSALSSVDEASQLADDLMANVRSALDGLGYKEREYAPLLREIEQKPPAQEFQDILKYAIAMLSSRARANIRTRSGADALDEVF